MAIRTTEDAVKTILADHYGASIRSGTGIDVSPFITAASTIVDYVSSQDSDGIHSTSSLEVLERWLAAWAYGDADLMHQSESRGGASATAQGQTGMVFNSNYYGQKALALDFTGTLAKLQKQAEEGPKTAGMTWLGTRYKNDDSERSTDQ